MTAPYGEELLDYATLPLPLNITERQELAECETIIEHGLHTFYAVGRALGMISRKKLYRAEFRTFEDYCRERWNISRPYAYELIEDADIRHNLSGITDKLPETASQAKALKGLELEQQRRVIEKAVDTAPGGKVTAQHIKDVRQAEIPMPEPEPAPVHQISVCVPQEQPRPQGSVLISTTPAFESRHDWTCTACQHHFPEAWGFFYASGRSLCRACAVKSDPCAVCKSAHPHCDGCCDQCKHPCNIQQACRLDVRAEDDDDDDEREPDAVITDESEPEPANNGIWYGCDFCGKSTQHAYNTFKEGIIQASICEACAEKAITALHPSTPPAAQAEEPFQFYQTDRVKMVTAGLRVFRADDYACVIKEFNGTGWELFEKHESKAALKRSIATWANSPNMIFERI